MHSIVPTRLRATALLISAIVAASMLLFIAPATSATADTAPPLATTPTTASTDVLPTVQINGVIWSEAIVGDTVYAGGKFTSARPAGSPAGTNESPRSNLVAFNIKTGVMTSFAPTINGEVRAVAASPDGTRLYIGGVFDNVNGVGRFRIAAFDTATGTLISSFKPIFNTRVNAIAATNTAVYVGGWFTSVANSTTTYPRTYVAKLAVDTGLVQPFNATIAGGTVAAVAVSPDGSQLIVGGSFTTANGLDGTSGGFGGYGLTSLDTTTGASLQWHVNSLVRNGGSQASITSLTSDSDGVYGTGYVFGAGGNTEGMFHASWTNGDLISIEDCHGDTYGTAPIGNIVYTVSHSHYCGNDGGFPQTSPTWTVQRGMAWTKSVEGTITADPYGYYNFAGNPRPGILDFWPDLLPGSFTGQGQAAWAVVANSQYVVMGGEFPDVNNIAQQGLVRFAVSSIAPNKDGPRPNGSSFVPTAISRAAGTARISWIADYDRDNANLKYELIRDGVTATPVYTTNQISHIWYDRPQMGYIDTGLTPGQTYTYQVRVTDPFGNSVKSAIVSVTASATGSFSSYDQGVMNDGATSYWRLGETTGTAAYDSVGFNDAVISGGVTQGTAGAVIGDADTADTFNGSNGLVATQTAIPGPDTFALEGWFKTTSTSGGKIVGFGNSNTGTSSSYDRHVYMDAAGHVNFGVYPGSSKIITSSKTYNDGQWHYFGANLSSSGMQLYVDGIRVAQNTSVTSGQAYSGYWRIGGDSSWSGNNFFNGAIDDVAIYNAPLTQSKVTSHYNLSGRTSTLPTSPSDAYGAAVFAASPDIYWRLGESSGSTAKDSSISGNDGTYRNGVTKGATGAISGTTDTAATFNGSNGLVSSNGQFNDPETYTEELWFNTTTTRGGKLIGFGNAQSGNSSNYDRHIWMQNSGQVAFGVYTGQENVILSPSTYNNGQWHHVVATQSSAGLALYLDGVLVGTNPTTQAQAYAGYWRVGGDTVWENSTSRYFNGKIDDVAVYGTALDAPTVLRHYQLGTGTVPNAAPTASFTTAVNNLAVAFDGTGSTDSDGTIASYAWDFGDGSTSTSATPNHTYLLGGTYSVALTVTDNRGATNTSTQSVAVSPAKVAPTASFTTSATDLAVSFDAGASSDSDGIITNYAWDFGDGATATGVTTSHTFATGGNHTVVLTVTDNDALTDTDSQTLALVAPNVAPTASYTNVATGLSVAFDGTGSTDSDGTVASYAWDFGDGDTSTSATPTHVFATDNTYSVSLVVTDNGGLTDSETKSITVAHINVLPTASFTSSAADLVASFDGSGSNDSDGTIASYAWDFGDGTTGTGVSPTHTYPAGNTYTVALTVTDNSGGVGTKSGTITVTPPPGSALATDAFGRTTIAGWGTADAGGVWTLTGTATNFNVGSGTGQVSTAAGQTRTAALKSVSSSNVDLTARIALDRVSTGGGVYVSLIGRQIGTASYSARLWFQSSGAVQLQIMNGGTIVQTSVVPSLTYTAGTQLQVRLQVTGTTSTTVRARVWKVGDTEPTTWRVSTIDTTTTALQAAGYIGLQSYVSSSATGTPVNVSFDNLNAIPAGTVVANQLPTASFTSSTAGLTASFNGSGSSDPDGTIASYSWDFGDGTAAGTGVSPSHTYATSGTKTVVLTVTDNSGGTATRTDTVSVTGTANVLPTASFTSSAADLVASFDGSGSTDSDGTIASYAWDFGDGTTGTGVSPTHTYATANTYTVALKVTDNDGGTNTKTGSITVTAAPGSALATDAFGRTATAAWGTADTGGVWTLTGTAANFNVGSGTGQVSTAAGQTRTAALKSVSSSNVDITAKLSLDTASTGGGVYVSLIGRQIGTASYSARLWFQSSGAVQLQIMNGGTVVQTSVVPSLTYTAGTQLQVRLQVTGTTSTTVRARVWKVGDTEPTTWRVSTIDTTTTALQAAGYIGVQSYVSGTATSTPVTVKFDDLNAIPAV